MLKCKSRTQLNFSFQKQKLSSFLLLHIYSSPDSNHICEVWKPFTQYVKCETYYRPCGLRRGTKNSFDRGWCMLMSSTTDHSIDDDDKVMCIADPKYLISSEIIWRLCWIKTQNTLGLKSLIDKYLMHHPTFPAEKRTILN